MLTRKKTTKPTRRKTRRPTALPRKAGASAPEAVLAQPTNLTVVEI